MLSTLPFPTFSYTVEKGYRLEDVVCPNIIIASLLSLLLLNIPYKRDDVDGFEVQHSFISHFLHILIFLLPLTLQLADTIARNCNNQVLGFFASKEFMRDITKLAMPKVGGGGRRTLL